MRRRSKGPLHLCEIHGAHWNVGAVGYVTSTTYIGQRVFVWGCAECRDWWLDRHPDANWTDWETHDDT